MKTLFKATLIAAIAVVSLASCNRVKESPVTKNDVHFVLKAKMPETRTGAMYGEGSYEPYFQSGDKLGVLFSLPSAAGNLTNDAVFSNTKADGEDAAFEGTVSLDDGAGITFYSYYPADAGKKVYVASGVVTLGLDVAPAQTPAYHSVFGYSFDPAADILIAKPATCAVTNSVGSNDVDMYFSRVTGVLRVALNMAEGVTGYGERVSKFIMETNSGDIAGRVVINPVSGEYVGTNSVANSKTITATFDPDVVPVYVGYESVNNVFLCTAPVTIPTGSTLTFTIETVNAQGQNAHKIVKTITSTPKDIVFRSGEPAVINLNIVESEVGLPDSQDPNDYSGEYLITNTDHTLAAEAWVSTNDNLKTVAITYQNNQVTYDDDVEIDNCKMTITKVTTGEYSGMYTIQDANALYLHPASSSKNYIRGYSAESLDKNGYWTITNTEGAWTIVATKSEYSRNEMRFNGNIVSCYSSGQSPVDLVSWSKVVLNTTPQIIVEETSKSVDAAATSVTFTYTTKNIDGALTVTVSDNEDGVVNGTPEAANGTVTVALNPNTEAEEKTATITLSYEGAASVDLTITQAAYFNYEWTLVTDASQLTVGDQVVIASTSKGKVANTNLATDGYLGETATEFGQGGIATLPNDALILTLGGEAGAWTLSNAQNKKLGSTAAKKLAFGSGTTTWSITVSNNGDATIQNGTSSYGRMLHNVSSNRFTTYTSNTSTSMLLPQLYRKPGVPDDRIEVTMSFNPAGPFTHELGTSFTEPELTVDPAVAEVVYSIETSPANIAEIDDETGELNITGAGTITVTASVVDEETYKPASASYTLTVIDPNQHDGSLERPYNATDVRGFTSQTAPSGKVYVEGTISELGEYSDEYHNYTYTITDGTSSALVFRGKYLGGADFTSANQLKVGDEVIVYGNIGQYQNVYQLSQNNQLYSLNGVTKLPTITKTDISDVSADGVTDATTTVTFADNDGWTASVTPDGNIVTAASISGQTITYTVAANDAGARSGSITVSLSRTGFNPVTSTISVDQLAGVNGGSYTIVFKKGSGDGSSASTSTACSDIVSEGSSYLSGNLATATNVYYNGGSGLKLGKSGGAGTIKMNLVSAVTPTSIVVVAKRYNATKAVTLKVNGSETQGVTGSEFSSYTYSITNEITYLELISSTYCWIESITVNY